MLGVGNHSTFERGNILNENAVRRIGGAVLGNAEFEGLHTFFKKVWESEYDYVAVLARRCFALHNIFMRCAEGSDCIRAKRVISHNALLFYAHKFAKHYSEYKKFPSVLLVDDLLIHGRGMGRILYHFENLICKDIESTRGQELEYSERNLIHYNLSKAIQMRVYAINKAPLLIEGLYRHQIEAETERYGSQLKNLSQQISSFIQEINEPNTSYRYSVMLPRDYVIKAENEWKAIDWHYRGEQSKIYFSSKNNGAFVPMVYAHGIGNLNNNQSVWITGLSIGGDVSIDKFDQMCFELANILSQTDSEKIFTSLIRILLNKEGSIQRQRIQFVSFLLSLVNVSNFLNQCHFKQNQEQIEFTLDNRRHIATNFGFEDDALTGISRIIDNQDIMDHIRPILFDSFSSSTEMLLEATKQSGRLDIASVNDAIDRTFQKIGMNAEIEAYNISTNKIRFRPDKYGEDTVSLKDCMQNIRNCLNAKSVDVTDQQIIAGLTAVVDSGLAALNFGYAPGKGKVQCLLKAGELSTFSTPRKWHWFIPALSWVENECFDFAVTPVDLVKEFIGYLAELDINISANDALSSDEKTALKDIIKHGPEFVDQLYYCKQSFNSWNMQLLTIGDWREERDKHENKSYYAFLLRHDSRCRYYLELAKSFIAKKRQQSNLS